ncbi:HIT family protein, partial [Candidatus Woesearchaeota archaeon]|nr:HIT family protein [Candidatus Woesearchaeota archaeon]
MTEEQKLPNYIYEDDHVVCMLNPMAATKGHAMVIPKQKISVSSQMNDQLAAHVFMVANKLSAAIFEAMGATGTNILVSNGASAGQRMEQFAVHIIPRYEDDKVNLSWESSQLTEEEIIENNRLIQSKLTVQEVNPVNEEIKTPGLEEMVSEKVETTTPKEEKAKEELTEEHFDEDEV